MHSAGIGILPARVYCFDYNSENGVKSPQGKLENEVEQWRDQLGLQSTDEIDIVAHSMGGLVARYAVEVKHSLGAVHSVNMLGTPNRGAAIIKVAKFLCANFAQNLCRAASSCSALSPGRPTSTPIR